MFFFYLARIGFIMDRSHRLPAGYVPIPGSGVFPHAADGNSVDRYVGGGSPVRAPVDQIACPSLVKRAISEGVGDTRLVKEILTYLIGRGVEIPEGSIGAFNKAIARNEQLKRIGENRDLLDEFLSDLQLDLQLLQEGTPYIFLGRLKKSTSPILERFLPPEVLAWFQDPDSFLKMIREEVLEHTGSSPLAAMSDAKEMVSERIRLIKEKMQRALPPTWYSAIAESLKKDFDELAGEIVTNTVWEKMIEGNLETVLTQAFSDVFSEFQAQVFKTIHECLDDAKIPPPLRVVFDEMGIASTQNSEFWVEIRKTGVGLYHLKIHGSDTSRILAPVTLPIEFSEVPEALLNDHFWESLLRFPLWIENKEEVDFSINDLYETLKGCLGKAGVSSEKEVQATSVWKMVESYLGSPQKTIEEELSSKGKELGPLAFSSLFTQSQSRIKDSMILPPLLQDLIAQMGGVNSDCTSLKEIIATILGEKVDDSIDLFLKEIPKGYPSTSRQQAIPKTWSQILGFDFFHDLKKMRISLLHGVRLGAKISVFVATLVSWTVTVDFLASLLMVFFPGLNLVVGLSVKYLASALLMYGDKVLSQIVPSRLIRPIQDFFSAYHKILQKIEYKAYLLLLKISSRFLLTKEYVEELKHQIEVLKAELKKEGEIDYKLRSSETPPSLHVPEDETREIQGRSPMEPVAFCAYLDKLFDELRLRTGADTFVTLKNNIHLAVDYADYYFPETIATLPDKDRTKLFELLEELKKNAGYAGLDFSSIEIRMRFLPFGGDFSLDREICPISLENLQQCLKIWCSQAKLIPESQRRVHYLNQRIRNLPIPGSSGGEIWCELPNPDEVLEDLENLMNAFSYEDFYYRFGHVEFVVSVYALYAVIDATAKNTKTTYKLPPCYPRDGEAFLVFFNAPGVRPIRRRTRLQMRALLNLFGGDPDVLYKKKKKSLSERVVSLFNHSYGEVLEGSFPPADNSYLDESYPFAPVIERSIAPGSLEFDNFRTRRTVLFTERPQLKAYYLVRSIHIHALRAVCFSGRWDFQRKSLSQVTFKWRQKSSEGSAYKFFHRVFMQQLRNFTIQASVEIPQGLAGIDLYTLRDHSVYLFDSEREQSEIVTKGVCPELSAGHHYPRDVANLIEMAALSVEDQIVRTLSLFISRPKLLMTQTGRRDFETLVLSPRAIRAAFKDRGNVIYEMGPLFQELYEALASKRNVLSTLFVASVGEEFLFLAEEVAPNIRDFFPNFRQLVALQRPSRDANIVLCAMVSNVDSEAASIQEKAEILEILNSAKPHFQISKEITDDFLKGAQSRAWELFWSWSPCMEVLEIEEMSSEITSAPAQIEIKKPVLADLSKESHRLHLLEWFQPQSEIKVLKLDGYVASIEFEKLQLKFVVRLEEGERKAYCQDAKLNAFWIAKCQKDPRLHTYPNSLLLESASGEKRVLLPLLSPTALFSETLLHSLKTLHSPLLEKILTTIEGGDKFYVYQFTEEGALDSSDPEALSYLTLLHIGKNDSKLSFSLFYKLIRLAKQKSFNEGAIVHIHSMLTLLLVSQNPHLSTFFLRLIALMEENRLIQASQSDSSEFRYLLLAIVCAKYNRYLEEEEAYLSEYEELFIFKYITANTPIPNALKMFSSFFSNVAMLPLSAKRYQLLRRKHLGEDSSIQNQAEHLFLHALIGDSSISDTNSVSPPSRVDPISDCTRVFQKMLALAKHPLIAPDFSSVVQNLNFGRVGFFNAETSSIATLTNSSIFNGFIPLYTLFYVRTPGTWEELAKSVLSLQGTCRDKEGALRIYILQTVASASSPKIQFPDPKDVLEKESSRTLLIRRCAAINAMDGLFSLLKKKISNPMSLIPKDLSFLVPSPLKMALTSARALFGIVTAIRSFPNLPEIEDAEGVLDSPIDLAMNELLVAREREIDSQIALNGGEPFSSCFQRPFEYLPEPEAPLSERREFQKLNHSIVEYARKPTYSEVSHGLTISRERIEAELQRDKRELEALTGMFFEEIEIYFLYGEDSKWDRETLLKIYLYKVSRSRWNAYFSRGAAKRAYLFNDLPEKALRVLLTFEEKANTLIWQKQYGPLKNLIREASPRHVCEMIMGLGKTDALMPIANRIRADGKTLVINIRPQAIFKSAVEKSSQRSHQIFSQVVNTVPLTRSGWSFERLEALYIKINQVKTSREVWDGVKEELQSLELRFIEEALDIKGGFASAGMKEWEKRILYFKKVLKCIRTESRAEIDEVHTEFERKNELNFPLGSSKALKEEHAEVIADVVKTLLSIPELARLINLKSEAPSVVERDLYEREVLPILIHALSDGDITIVHYLQNRGLLDSPNPRIDLIKGILNNLLPSILQEVLHVNYGTTKTEGAQFAIPSSGNENPQERSTFKNQFAAFLKTVLLLVHDRLTATQLQKFIDYLKERAELELKESDPSIEDLNRTKQGRYFRENCPGFELFSFTERDRVAVYQTLNLSDQVVLDYACIFIRKQIRYYAQSVSSNAHNFASMFKAFSGYTASPYNKGTYPQGTQILYDKGTQGETATLLHERNSPCYVLENPKPEEALEELLTTFFENESLLYRAIIDRGAVFNGMSNDQVAQAILSYLERERPDLLGVVFYNKDKELCIWEKGKEAACLLSESIIPPERRVTYFDQSHTYAADILQAQGAKALVTIGEQLIAEDLFQAVWRMRGLKVKKQSLTFVMTRAVNKLISGDDQPNTDAIIRFGLKQQARKSEEDNYYSDLAALSNIIRRAVLDKALAASTVEDTVEIIRNFRSLFLSENSGDPTDFFGGLEELATPQEILRDTKKRLRELMERVPLFETREIYSLSYQLEGIGHQAYPRTVLKRDTSAIQRLIVDEETNQDEEELEEIEIVQSIEQTLEGGLERRSEVRHKSWDLFYFQKLVDDAKRIVPFSSSPLTMLKFFSMQRILSIHNLEELKALASFIDPRILATNNLMPEPSTAFDYFQIPPLEALIVEGEGEITSLILLSAKDAGEWRKMLPVYEKKFALIDIRTQLIVSESPNRVDRRFLSDSEFQLMLLQIRFLSGETNFSKRELPLLDRWLRILPFRALKSFVSEKYKPEEYSNSSLQYLIYLIEKERVPGFVTSIRC